MFLLMFLFVLAYDFIVANVRWLCLFWCSCSLTWFAHTLLLSLLCGSARLFFFLVLARFCCCVDVTDACKATQQKKWALLEKQRPQLLSLMVLTFLYNANQTAVVTSHRFSLQSVYLEQWSENFTGATVHQELSDIMQPVRIKYSKPVMCTWAKTCAKVPSWEQKKCAKVPSWLVKHTKLPPWLVKTW